MEQHIYLFFIQTDFKTKMHCNFSKFDLDFISLQTTLQSTKATVLNLSNIDLVSESADEPCSAERERDWPENISRKVALDY